MSKVILNCIGFASLFSLIGVENLIPSINQSGAKLNQSWLGHPRFPALENVPSSPSLSKQFPFFPSRLLCCFTACELQRPIIPKVSLCIMLTSLSLQGLLTLDDDLLETPRHHIPVF